MSASALLADRLASNSAASTAGPALQHAYSRLQDKEPVSFRRVGGLRQLSLDVTWKRSKCFELFGLEAKRGFKFRRRATQSGTLQQADYAVYQQLPREEITESFLWGRLKPLLGYLKEEDRQKVQEALSLALDAHAGQLRKSGEPFITHPVEVARVLAELHMDKECLIAGLLHDTVEDNPTQITFEEIGNWFGQAVRTIVEGETKFSKIGQLSENGISSAELKARDLQHLFLAMTKEVRIIVVKLADRLHNMRTLGSMPCHKQRKIADETLQFADKTRQQVFAPLARLLGLYSIKEELEELAFSYSKPEEYAMLRRRLDNLGKEQEPVVRQAQQTLEEMLREDSYLQSLVQSFTVAPSQKSVYSVYRKMQENKASLGDVTNVAQLCVVMQLKEEKESYLYGTGAQLCYHVMGLVHAKWAPIPGSIKDYIATPKRNGYQSLHTTVLPLGSTPLFPLEVQIRTSKMQELAEFGIAGEKWVATDAETYSFEQTPTAAFKFESNGSPDRPSGLPSLRDLIRMLPRLVGLNHDLVHGNATLAVNGLPVNGMPVNGATVIMNGAPVSGLEDTLAGRQAFTANGHALPKIRQNGAVKLDRDVLKRREHWLKSIIEWQKEFLGSLTAREFVDGITDDLLGRGVFVFTPGGDLMRLPKDSTPVDFAYHVHTDVGDQMVGAKVNGKHVAPERLLANAEVVEILTYDGKPTRLMVSRHKEWVKCAKSKTARHKLAKFLRDNMHLLPSEEQRRAGEASEAPEQPTPRSQEEPSVWLVVEGVDGPGLLAEMAQIIAKHGHDVKTYSGDVDTEAGTLRMRFEVRGLPEQCAAMCKEIGSAPFVRSWRLGCSLPEQQ